MLLLLLILEVFIIVLDRTKKKKGYRWSMSPALRVVNYGEYQQNKHSRNTQNHISHAEPGPASTKEAGQRISR